ncbi:MAG: hypothetical protein ABJJ13_22095, partial [Rhodopirellula bahusiensis]
MPGGRAANNVGRSDNRFGSAQGEIKGDGRPAPITPCPVCNSRGYHGRIGLYELLTPGPQLKAALAKSQDAGQLTAIAKSEGFRPVQSEAVLTVARGLTSLDELKRAFAK